MPDNLDPAWEGLLMAHASPGQKKVDTDQTGRVTGIDYEGQSQWCASIGREQGRGASVFSTLDFVMENGASYNGPEAGRANISRTKPYEGKPSNKEDVQGTDWLSQPIRLVLVLRGPLE